MKVDQMQAMMKFYVLIQPCVICGDEETTAKNLLILCDGEGCDIPVHLKCYGVEDVPPGDEKWHCQRCEDKVAIDATEAICCNYKGGAYKRTNFENKYIHVPCAWYNPAVEGTSDGFRIEKWLLDKQTCCICNESKGLCIRCKHPGCKQYNLFIRWFHVMCAIEKELIPLAKLRDIKHNAMCLEHVAPAKPAKINTKKLKDDAYKSDASHGSESESDINSVPSNTVTTVKESTLKRPNTSNETYPRKHVKSANGLPPKLPKTSSPGSKSPVPTGSALHYIMEKTRIIQEASLAIENMPSEYKRLLKEKRGSPLDGLLDQTVESTNNASVIEEKNREIQSLKLQLSQRPSVETMDRLHKELQDLRAQTAKQSSPNDPQYKTDRDNLLAIFSYLRLPNFAPPTEVNLSQFLASLRMVLERTNALTPSASPLEPGMRYPP